MPAVTGAYGAGLVTTSLTDSSRQAVFAPNPTSRLLGISIFYPTSKAAIAIEQPYFTASLALAFDAEHIEASNLSIPNSTVERLSMPLAAFNSSIAAPAAPSSSWPTLLFNPAYFTTRRLYSTLLSHLASTGYVVVAFDSPYDSDLFLDPTNGTNVVQGNSSADADDMSWINLDYDARTQDFLFVLDNLADLAALIPSCYHSDNSSCLNTTHVGTLGHSIGGAAAAGAAGTRDPRIVGAANLDGANLGDVVTKGFDVPYLLFTAEGQNSSAVPSLTGWNEAWNHTSAEKWWLILDDAKHYSFSDLPLMLEVMGVTWSNETGDLEQITRSLSGIRGLQIMVDFVSAFFGTCFRGGQSLPRILAAPDKEAWPEVTFDVRTSVLDNQGQPASYTSRANSLNTGQAVLGSALVLLLQLYQLASL
jgi:dienelactone hydrolase